jgi:ATP-dependent helicase HrpB
VGRHRRYWYDLILAEAPTEIVDRTAASELLWNEVRGHWDRVFPSDDTEIAQLMARLALVQTTLPEIGAPVLNEEAWHEIGRNICLNSLSLDQVRNGPWLDYAQSRVGYDWLQKLEQLAPRKILLPSGKEGAIEYRLGSPPSLAVRLQEVFGWQETPRILDGRQPLLLRLLAPNYREVQVTQDLASFWRTGYFEVRKELKRRYGKHHWPDDPLVAQATRSGLGRDAK